MSREDSKAVFLSYASQDAEAARRVCEALHAAGVEVWFDQSELRGGDVWDQRIRKQVKECALFVPIVSANTQARTEGYFRLEWRLADQRTHLMAKGRPFLLPVVIDDTRDAEAHVPDSFMEVQWTRLTGGETSAAFCERVKNLLGDEGVARAFQRVHTEESNVPHGLKAHATQVVTARRGKRLRLITALAAALVVATLALWRPWPRAVPAAWTGQSATPLSEARKLVAQARELFDDGDDMNRENFSLAEDLLKRALSLDPTDGEVWAAQAQISFDLTFLGHDRSSARREALRMQAERAVKLAPASVESQLAYAGYLLRTGDDAAAEVIARLQPWTERAPTNRRLFRLLARALEANGKLDEALAALDRISSFPGGNARELVGKAHWLIRWGRYEEAEIAIHQSLAQRATGRGQVLDVILKLSWRGDVDGASAAVDRWPAWLKVEDRGAFIASEVWLWQRKPDKALSYLNPVARDSFYDTFFTGPKSVLVALAHEMAGRPEAARAEWENVKKVSSRMLTEDPALKSVLAWKACALARLGEKAEADSMLRELEQTRQLQANFWSSAAPSALLRIAVGRGKEVPAKFESDTRSFRLVPSSRSPQAALKLNPVFDPVRSDPAFQRLIEQAPAPTSNSKPQTPNSKPTDSPSAKSVAVLAFRQLSSDPENEYLCEAISDELCSVLGRVPGLRVAASASAFSFKGKRVRPSEMAAQLGVAYLVDGTVQKDGQRVRVRAQLIKATDESTVWSSPTLVHELKDMFAVQDEIVGAIAKNLQLQLGAVARAVATNPEAYRLYYEGRRAWSLRGVREEVPRAEGLYRKALALDPNLGRAYAGLVDVSIAFDVNPLAGRFGSRTSPQAAEILALATKAVQLEPDSAETHTSRGQVLYFQWQFAEAERELRAAIKLNPNYADAHLVLGHMICRDGRMDEALAELRMATELDPLTSRLFDSYSLTLINAGRFREALTQAERALALQSDSRQALRARMGSLSALGRHDEAVVLARLLVLKYVDSSTHANVVEAFAQAGLIEEGTRASATMGGNSASRAAALAALGKRDDALAALDANEMSAPGLGYLFYRPALDSIRNEPRFVRLIEQLGVKDAHARAQAWRAAHPPEQPAAKK